MQYQRAFFIKADHFDMEVLSSIWEFLPAIASVAQNIAVFVTYHKHPLDFITCPA